MNPPTAHFVSCNKLSGNCCPSCHEDEDYDPSYTLYAEDVEVAAGVWVGVRYCCLKRDAARARVDKMAARLGGSGNVR
jgi:hypothetical protein